MTDTETAAVHRAAFGEKGWPAADFARYRADPAAILVARPGALALVRVAADEAEVLTLATDPAQRRRGLARAVLGEALALARARGARRAVLEVDAGNAAARALYDSLGFAVVAERRDYYRAASGDRSTAHVLALEL